MTPSEIVAQARAWLGVRYRHQGRSREGVDCAGLVIKVAHGCGLSTFDTADYARQATDETMLAICREHLLEVGLSDALPGDVLVLAFGSNRHLAIVGDYPGDGLSIIHAFLQVRRVVEQRLDEEMLRRARGCFRFPGLV
ncbi:MAG: C40 family peptidase [Blastomonas fulva]|jgi:cell wall-associated NlpC family hydrolase|uniref:C40 family peptidase n=1 Tax=Pseudomonadota TaxID=1224 RepID=UPI0040337EB9